MSRPKGAPTSAVLLKLPLPMRAALGELQSAGIVPYGRKASLQSVCIDTLARGLAVKCSDGRETDDNCHDEDCQAHSPSTAPGSILAAVLTTQELASVNAEAPSSPAEPPRWAPSGAGYILGSGLSYVFKGEVTWQYVCAGAAGVVRGLGYHTAEEAMAAANVVLL